MLSVGGVPSSYSHSVPSMASIGSGSWNPNVPCGSPWIVKVTDITDNLTGSTSYNNSPFSPGIDYAPAHSDAKRWLTPGATPSGWVSPGPSCTITNLKGQTVASFVEIDNVRIGSTFYKETDCSTTFNAVNGGKTYTTGGSKCDVTANIYSSPTDSCTKSTDQGCWYKIHTEFDQDWQGAAYCGPSTVCDPAQAQSQIIAQSTYIDVQGFIFWDPDHVTTQWHSFSGWELHPLTAWRMHQSSTQPDFSVSASPSSMFLNQGSSAATTVTVTSLNGFSGTVNLGANVSPSGPTFSLASNSLTVTSGGSASTTLTVSASNSTTVGSYSITLSATSGALSHSSVVSLTVTSAGDFSISTNPSSLNLVGGGSAQSIITLTSLKGFTGSVSLSATVSGQHVRANLSPNSITLTSSGSASSTLTISTNRRVTPGTYTVTITAVSGSITHTTTITLTVT